VGEIRSDFLSQSDAFVISNVWRTQRVPSDVSPSEPFRIDKHEMPDARLCEQDRDGCTDGATSDNCNLRAAEASELRIGSSTVYPFSVSPIDIRAFDRTATKITPKCNLRWH
jgi:hypothetical protein